MVLYRNKEDNKIKKREVTINECTIGGTYTEVDLLKKCKKLFETDEFKSRRGFYPLCNRLTTKESTG